MDPKDKGVNEAPPAPEAAINLDEEILKWKERYGADSVYDMTPQKFEDDEDWKALGMTRIICRRPDRADLSRLAKGLAGDSLKAMWMLVMDCLLYPSATALERLLSKKPGLMISLGGALQELAGVMTDFLPKRL